MREEKYTVTRMRYEGRRPPITGNITVHLFEEKAPVTVANFKQYVESGHYNKTLFHRVIPGFVLQGGGFTPDMVQKPTVEPIKNEAANGIKNSTGTLSMARTRDVDSATSQFFINLTDNEMLNHRDTTESGYGYCVFGEVTDGMDLVNRIAEVETGSSGPHSDVPLKPVVITDAQMDDETTVILTVEQM